METLHVEVVSLHGIVYSESFTTAEGKDMFSFSLTLTEKMQPASTIFMYYVRKNDGAIIHDSLPLNFDVNFENYVSRFFYYNYCTLIQDLSLYQ